MHARTKQVIVGMLVIFGTIAMVGATWAEDVKEQMRTRLPVIVELKARGVTGENNQGFLEMLKGQTEKQDVVAAENQDRKSIYAQIAQKTGTDVKVVGQRRAIQIAEKASAGEWLQDASGKWHQK
ncbi:MAG: YdbL family protein [Desulfatitalea sp.]